MGVIDSTGCKRSCPFKWTNREWYHRHSLGLEFWRTLPHAYGVVDGSGCLQYHRVVIRHDCEMLSGCICISDDRICQDNSGFSGGDVHQGFLHI